MRPSSRTSRSSLVVLLRWALRASRSLRVASYLNFAIVHQPADRRSAAGRDLDEVKPPLLCEIQGLASGHDAKLLARFVNQPDFRYADSLVDAIVPWYTYTSLNKQSVRIGRQHRI